MMADNVDLTKPHWKCICGAVAMPLTDETTCQCSDIYEQEWTRIDPVAEYHERIVAAMNREGK